VCWRGKKPFLRLTITDCWNCSRPMWEISAFNIERKKTSWLLMKHSAMLSTRDTPCSRFPDSLHEYAQHMLDFVQWILQICSLLRVHPSILEMWSDRTGSCIWSGAVEMGEGRAVLRKLSRIQLQNRAFKPEFQSFRGLSFPQTFTACFLKMFVSQAFASVFEVNPHISTYHTRKTSYAKAAS